MNSATALLEHPIRLSGDKYLDYSGFPRERLTHYLFRYPAKFHPPIVRTLIERYTEPGMHLLDPFCGSGTTLVEAVRAGRCATGTDIDPLAVFVSSVKTRRYQLAHLRRTCSDVLKEVAKQDRGHLEYERLMFDDLDEADVLSACEAGLWVPWIPRIYHWFRKYVIIDLGRILHVIRHAHIPMTHADFLRLCFASIIRSASNADPVPVSGLEVTAHMKRVDQAGRVVNAFALFARAVSRALADVEDFVARAGSGTAKARQIDATSLSKRLRSRFDAVVTSPPYNNAVDYYRRHQLETFWLNIVSTQQERLKLKHQYIGRARVRREDLRPLSSIRLGRVATGWERAMRDVSPARADAFQQYIASMQQSFREVAVVLRPRGRAVYVVGHSQWQEREIPTSQLLIEAAENALEVEDVLWYPIKDRYMSYSRHNGANIDKEYVVVLRKRACLPA
jgi:16S rRNA G966 N2-methylase RsmD